jgi:lipoprotein-anchoring transpeptidase ErfK/SrfK
MEPVRRKVWGVAAACVLATACTHASTPPPSPPAVSPVIVASPVATSDAPAHDAPLLAHGATTVVRSTGDRFHIYRRPGPGAVLTQRLAAANDWQQPLALPAVGAFTDADGTDWYHVRLPVRPNGSLGWVRGDDVTARAIHERIEVDLSAHRLRRIVGGDAVESISVGDGAATTPTPPGRFFVWAHVPTGEPHGPYGVFALGLSGFSDVITDWIGGGRLAIHGTDDPGDRGNDVSHGCVRVYNPEMRTLTDVPLGTPVWIHP